LLYKRRNLPKGGDPRAGFGVREPCINKAEPFKKKSPQRRNQLPRMIPFERGEKKENMNASIW